MSGSPKVKTSTGGVKVAVRVRPFNSREKALSEQKEGEILKCIVAMEGRNCIVLDKDRDYEPDPKLQAFVFDECFWSMPEDENNPLPDEGFADQKIVYEKCGAEALTNAWEGYNTCIFAYGQTGAGKSFSMLGAPGLPGISPQIITNIFKHIEEQTLANPKMTFKVECCFFEIYMEKVKDLFAKDKNSEYAQVKIRQHPLYGIQVQGLETKLVRTEKECADEMDYGVSQRSLASTKMNATSSRSHAIFQIHIGTNDVVAKTKTTATINLVDLAGSERIGKTGATGQTKEEGMAINLSLSTLRKVMDALVDLGKGKKTNPPYRESMLTWVLKESLGGNSKTIMVTAISPHYDNLEDTISTLRYGLKAKAIVNKAVKQETSANKQAAQFKAAIADLEEQLRQAKESGAGATPEEIQDLQAELQAQREADAQVQGELHAMEEKATALEVDLANAKKRAFASAFRSAFGMGQRQQRSQELERKLEHMESVEGELKQQIASVEATKATVEADLKRRSEELCEQQDALAAEKRSREEERQKLATEQQVALERLRDEQDEVRRTELDRAKDTHSSEMAASLRRQREDLLSDKEELRQKLEIEIDGHRAQAAERSERIRGLEGKVNELEPLLGEVAKLNDELAMLRAQNEAQKSTLSEQQRQSTALQHSYEQLAMQSERDAAHYRQKTDELRAEYQQMRQERDQFRKQVLTLQVLHSADARIISAMSSTGDPTAAEYAYRSPSPEVVRAALPTGSAAAAGYSPRAPPSTTRRSYAGSDGAVPGPCAWRRPTESRSPPGAGAAASPTGQQTDDCPRCGSPRRAASPASPDASATPGSAERELKGVARLAAALPPSSRPRDRGAISAHRLSGARSWSPSPHRERAG